MHVGQLSRKLRDLYKSLEECKHGERHLIEVNNIFRKLARKLIPLDLTTGGRYSQDMFGTDLSKPLLALKEIEDLSSLKKGSPEHIMLSAKIYKRKNIVDDALLEAGPLLDAFCKKGAC